MGAKEVPKRYDDLIVFGRYVGIICILAECSFFVQCSIMFYMVFGGAAPPMDTLMCNGNETTRLLSTVEKCDLIRMGNCSQPTFDYQFKSVNVEFNLLCDDVKSVKNTISLQMFGVLVGSIIFGQLSDNYGRKKSFLAAMIGTMVSGTICAYMPSLLTFAISRFAVGIFTGGHIAVFHVFFIESIPKKSRLWINMLITWSPNMPLLAVIAYYCHTWRALSLAISAVQLLGIGILLFFVHESPRWMIQKGQITGARAIVNNILLKDGHHVAPEVLDSILHYEHTLHQQQSSAGKRYSYLHLFKRKSLLIMTVVLSFTYFATSVTNYAIIFQMDKLTGSLYMNTFYMGCMRYAANVIVGWLDFQFIWAGRKLVHSSGLIVVMMAAALVVYSHACGKAEEYAFYIRMAILLAASMTSQVYISASILANELFPTPIRNLGYSFLQIWNRFGVVISPFIFYLADYWIALPFVVMILTATIDLTSWGLLLPETKGNHMVEQMPAKKPSKRLLVNGNTEAEKEILVDQKV